LLLSITFSSRFSFRFCAEKVERGGGGVFRCLWAFFEGVLRKAGGSTWFFCGENVVGRVVNAVTLTVVIS
jgi:hypothetical protein